MKRIAARGTRRLVGCRTISSSPPVLPDCSSASIATLFDQRPDVAEKVLEKLSDGKRRYLLVAASMSEWQPGNIGTMMDQVDSDGDAKISQAEYRDWVEEKLEAKKTIPWKTLLLVAAQAGAPFVAFGFLDNSVMILSGDAIDNMFGERFALTAMGAAALGGVCSGTFGIQVHGVAERLVQKLNMFPTPQLVGAQRRHPFVFRATHIGGTVGISIGLLLGMLPLLIVGGDDETLNGSTVALGESVTVTMVGK